MEGPKALSFNARVSITILRATMTFDVTPESFFSNFRGSFILGHSQCVKKSGFILVGPSFNLTTYFDAHTVRVVTEYHIDSVLSTLTEDKGPLNHV